MDLKAIHVCQICGNIMTTLFTTVVCEYCNGTKKQGWNFQWSNDKFYMDRSRVSRIGRYTINVRNFEVIKQSAIPRFISCTRCGSDKIPVRYTNSDIYYWCFYLGGISHKWLCHDCAEATKLSKVFKWKNGFRKP